MKMERLPSELFHQIFCFLDYQNLAAAQKVCRKWKIIASDENLWAELFKKRWGESGAALSKSKPWRYVYSVQNRSDRYGLEVKIIREGSDYYIISRGEIQRHLGSSQQQAVESHTTKSSTFDTTPSDFSMLDRILFFLGDFEAAVSSQAKRCRFSEGDL